MQDFSRISDEIRQAAEKLLEEGRVDVVIGFEPGTSPLRATPCFIRSKDEAGTLVWNSLCDNNLARYVRNHKGNIGIVAKGCDSRALLELIKENQISRDQVVIIGIPCEGMVDRRQLEAELDGREILEVTDANGEISLKGAGFEKVFKKEFILHQSCKVCAHKNPVIHDILIGEAVQEGAADTYAEVAEFASKPADERWQYLSDAFSKCIRCYACRDACPFCYCEECFVDSSQPQWLGKSIDPSDTMFFHIMRAFHMAGRCVDCGACQRACPMGIDFRKLLTKLESDVKGLYGYEAGLSLEESAPLATFDPNDPQEFMIQE